MKQDPQFGTFQIEDVKMGGMGIVYILYDPIQDARIVAKGLQEKWARNSDLKSLFIREVEIWLSLGWHPNIVSAISLDEQRNSPYILLEYIQGISPDTISLYDWMTNRKPSILQTLTFALQIAYGMEYATERIPSLIHRDIKPENILIDGDLTAKITDFGLGLTATSMNRDLNLRGTPQYMAPELWQSKIPNTQTDIYAFGCMLYQVLTGTLPFKGQGNDLGEKHINLSPTHLQIIDKDIPQQLDYLVMKCMAKDRSSRTRTFKDLVNELSAIYAELTGTKPNRLTLHSEPIPNICNRATALGNIGRYQDALDLCKPYLTEKSLDTLDAFYVQRTLGGIYLDKRDFGKAFEHLLKASDIFKANTSDFDKDLTGVADNTRMLLAVCLSRFGKHDAAIVLLQELVQSYPKRMSMWINIGNVYDAAGYLEKALACYDTVLDIDPTYSNAWFDKGIALDRAGRYGEALESFDHALEINPSYEEALMGKSQTFLNMNQMDDAIVVLDQLLVINPNHPRAWFNQAVLWYKKGIYLKSIRSFARAKELGLEIPREFEEKLKEAEDLWEQGVFLRTNGYLSEALKHFKAAIRISPHDPRFWNSAAITFHQLGKLRFALFYYDWAITFAPDDPLLWTGKGNAFSDLGNNYDAMSCFDHALDIDFNFGQAWLNKGILLFRMGKWQDARFHLQHAASFNDTRLQSKELLKLLEFIE